MKKFLLTTIVIWVILFVVSFFTGSDDITFSMRFFGSLVMATISAACFVSGNIGEVRKAQDTGLISCKKCGYIGVGSGFCPKCGWNFVEKINSDTQMISCKKCGYLGAGSGFCTRCGSTWVEKINK